MCVSVYVRTRMRRDVGAQPESRNNISPVGERDARGKSNSLPPCESALPIADARDVLVRRRRLLRECGAMSREPDRHDVGAEFRRQRVERARSERSGEFHVYLLTCRIMWRQMRVLFVGN